MTVELQSYWRDSADTILSEADMLDLLSDKKTGIYIFDGKTGCGKSRILRKLKQRCVIRVLSTEEISDMILAFCLEDISLSLSKRLAAALSGFDRIAIEDIDLLCGKTNTLGTIRDALQPLAKTHQIILNGIDLEQLTPELSRLPDAQYFRVCP